MKLTVAEMFAGVGGFRVGLNNIKSFDNISGLAKEKKVWDFVWANQWEPSTKTQNAFNCYTTRFGINKHHSNEDINEVNKYEIPSHSLLVGGFPCQDYSVARSLSKEKGIEGKKGVLFWAIKEVIQIKNPPFILLENVDRLLKSPANQRGRDFAIMLKTLEDLGYIVMWRVINAAEYNMPQKRRRVFIFAFSKSTKYSEQVMKSIDSNSEEFLNKEMLFNKVFPIEQEGNIKHKDLSSFKDSVDITKSYNQGKFLNSGIYINSQVFNFDPISVKEQIYTLGKIIEEANRIQGIHLDKYIIPKDKVEKWEYLKKSKRIERTKPNGEKYYYSEGNMNFPDDLESPGRTMLTSESTTNRSSHIICDQKTKNYRTITEIEAELLQMFPANWTNTGMPKRNRYFVMGNALVTGIISRLEPNLKNIIENE